jgi:two-component system sensor histidine kinase YesM
MRLRFNSISVQVFGLFLICAILLIVLLSAIFYKRTTDQINQRIGEVSQNSTSQAADSISLIMKGYDSLSKSIVSNQDIQRLLLLEDPTNAIQKTNEHTIINLLATTTYSRDDVAGIHIIMKTGAVYGYGSFTEIINSAYATSDWYKILTQSTGDMVWLGMQEQSLIDLILQKKVFSFGRPIYDTSNNLPIGVILIEMQPTAILNTLNHLIVGSNGVAYILSNNNIVLAHSDLKEASQLLNVAEIPQFKEDENLLFMDKPDVMVGVGKPGELNWRIVNVTSKSALNLELKETKRFLIFVLGGLLLFAITLATFFSRSITAPIKKMVSEMKQVERGNFNITLKVNSFDEINFLVSGFNRMVSRMNNLVERVRFVSTSEKNAQLHALQSQVNPHFLYNTLDMIYWMLDEKGNEKLGNIILSLANMFRYSSDWENAEVTLREELEQVNHYLAILQVRMDGRLQLNLDIPERWLEILLPKMTLQPIIENAIIHGLTKQQNAGQLSLSTQSNGNVLKVIIEDNGVGITDKHLGDLQRDLLKITQLESELPGNEHTIQSNQYSGAFPKVKLHDSGVGLINGHRRLVLKFGAPYGLTLESEREKGTIVSVHLPIEPEVIG